ncbi:MAG TPA: aldehyde dehydrogenase family protein, partial [Gaiellales bacterium]|nr:aldehyde dehydrogenase family protein [Gaiellales bacterium]
MTTTLPGQDTDALLTHLGIDSSLLSGGDLEVRTPITGEVIANLHSTSEADAEAAIARSVEAFRVWRDVPAPRRGELVRLLA